MYYKYTLLKDLPEAKAGTSWTFDEPPEELKKEYRDKLDDETINLRAGDHPSFPLSTKTLKNPEWFKKELDEELLTEIKCPVCGETRGRIYATKEYKYVWADDVREDVFTVWFEFACGHKLEKLYTKGYYR